MNSLWCRVQAHMRSVLLCLLLPTLATAATIAATPSTFGARLAQLRPGDTLLLESGTYPPMSSHRYRFPSGTSWANAPQIRAAPGATVRTSRIQLQQVRFLSFHGINVACGGESREGVYLGPGTHHIRVQHGEVSRCTAHGVLIPKESGGYHQLLNLDIHHNGTRSHFDHGIYLSTGNTQIAHSHIHHNAGYGVHLYASGNPTVNRNIVTGNVIEENGQRGSTTYGIIVQDGAGNVVTGNRLRQNGTGDITVGARTRGTVLSGNQTSGRVTLRGEVSGEVPTGSPSGGSEIPLPAPIPPPVPPPPPQMPSPTRPLADAPRMTGA